VSLLAVAEVKLNVSESEKPCLASVSSHPSRVEFGKMCSNSVLVGRKIAGSVECRLSEMFHYCRHGSGLVWVVNQIVR